MKMHILDAAEQVLKEAGEPLHYGEITRRMARKGLWASTGKAPGAAVRSRLNADIKSHPEKSRFVRPQRGMFGLRSAGRTAAMPARSSAKRARLPRGAQNPARLEQLEQTLKDIRQDIFDRLDLDVLKSESKTRSYLVDPILKSLGWGPSTLDHELSTGPRKKEKVDIALRPRRRLEMIVEVKSATLDVSDKHVEQLQEYCLLGEVSLGLLTNGRVWRFYYGMNTNRKDYFAEEINIKAGDFRASAVQLDRFLGFDSVESGEAKKFIREAWRRRLSLPKWTQLLQRRWTALLPELTKAVEKDLKKSGKEIPRDVIETFLLERVNLQKDSDVATAPAPRPGSADAPVRTKSKPTHIELFGERRPFRGWRTSLREFLSEVYNRNPDSLRKLMEHSPRSFVQNPEKGRFRVPFNIGGSNVWVETHMSADGIQKLIRDVCRHLGFPESVFRPIY